MGGLDVRVLGPLEVRLEGEPRPLGGRKRRALLAALVLRRGELVPVDRLIDDVWSGARGRDAERSVQVYVSELRKALGDRDRIANEGNGYRLRLDPEEVDADRFERLLAEGRRLLAAGEPATAHDRLEEALALWRGRPLADLAYDAFAQLEIGRLEELRLVALEERAEAALALGRHRELVPELEALVGEHPLRERPRAQLMLALYRSERQAEALAAYADARRALVEELGLDPGPALRELEGAILRQDPALELEPADVRARRRLPAPATALVGRRSDVERLSALLRGDARLVTVTGPGGVGKTRTALQAAHDLAASFADGVVFVELAPLRDPSLVEAEIASALALDETAELSASLQERELLLLLDNFEQVEAAAPLLGTLLGGAPALRLLVTSRRPLRVYGEHVHALRPLELEEEALPLFLERARAAGADELAADDARRLCEAVDRLPLAIELVAARAVHLTAAELLAGVSAPLDLASAGARDLPERQRTLAAAIDWSYGLLSRAERDAFARLAVFRGGWTAEAAAEVAAVDRETLASLTEASLLRREGGRYGMLETIREYARGRLRASDAADGVARRHAEHFTALALASKESRRTPAEVEWHDRLERERDNLRAALDWLLEHDVEAAARLADGAYRFWYMRAHFDEGRRSYERVVRAGASLPAGERARQLSYASAFAFAQRDLERARRLAEESIALHRAAGDVEQVSRVLVVLGTILSEEGRDEAALTALRESIERAREVGDEGALAFALSHLTRGLLYAGDYAASRELGSEALELLRRLNDVDGERGVLLNLADASLLTGDLEAAAGWIAPLLGLARGLRQPLSVAEALDGAAAVTALRGAGERAGRLFGAAEAVAGSAGVELEAISVRVRRLALAAAEEAVGADALRRALEAGRELAPEAALTEAEETLARTGPPARAPRAG